MENDVIIPKVVLVIEQAMAKGYWVTSDGHVVAPRGNTLKASPNKRTTYLEVMLPGLPRMPGYSISVRVPVHKFQAYTKFGRAAFQGNAIHVRHEDNDKYNNGWANLLLGTAHENWQDMPAEQRSEKSRAGGRALTLKQRRINGNKQWVDKTREERCAIMEKVRKGGV